ncbi:uncharacterized protein BDZ99DRAFT_495562 [Mytilinidion resinicola]|uniref:Uncharacterized protein n=1 Tax=Mytilinidion resinicola TaxID=574789 RepID=A0A6A6Z1D5_9PEZI|nr:uncharacterized protein BDZ99DRAFT_495562 [Mytilinidion resinicola]KAF2813985.1 hypothetical protein BDZ99DRAFT_495562 [Mytilinidion resinicola]
MSSSTQQPNGLSVYERLKQKGCTSEGGSGRSWADRFHYGEIPWNNEGFFNPDTQTYVPFEGNPHLVPTPPILPLPSPGSSPSNSLYLPPPRVPIPAHIQHTYGPFRQTDITAPSQRITHDNVAVEYATLYAPTKSPTPERAEKPKEPEHTPMEGLDDLDLGAESSLSEYDTDAGEEYIPFDKEAQNAAEARNVPRRARYAAKKRAQQSGTSGADSKKNDIAGPSQPAGGLQAAAASGSQDTLTASEGNDDDGEAAGVDDEPATPIVRGRGKARGGRGARAGRGRGGRARGRGRRGA